MSRSEGKRFTRQGQRNQKFEDEKKKKTAGSSVQKAKKNLGSVTAKKSKRATDERSVEKTAIASAVKNASRVSEKSKGRTMAEGVDEDSIESTIAKVIHSSRVEVPICTRFSSNKYGEVTTEHTAVATSRDQVEDKTKEKSEDEIKAKSEDKLKDKSVEAPKDDEPNLTTAPPTVHDESDNELPMPISFDVDLNVEFKNKMKILQQEKGAVMSQKVRSTNDLVLPLFHDCFFTI